MKKVYLFIAAAFASVAAAANSPVIVPVPEDLPEGYPRIYITEPERGEFEKMLQRESWAQGIVDGLHSRVDKYVQEHVEKPDLMPSRLQMYWNTKCSNVYIKGITYSHADGSAPVPTVRFSGSRDNTTDYLSPSIEEITPYMDDPRGLYLRNKTKEGNPFEWAPQAKVGVIIEKINERIMELARDAAFLYWLEGDERYAKFAFDVFDVYMQGMYYRNEPIDLNNGHIQTLVGLTCYQVIHESILTDIAELYDFLHAYLAANHSEKMDAYQVTMKKWIDLIIKNGVPQNNWNLHQANIILKATMVLEDNAKYSDGKGREHYIDGILNVTTPRQWSFTELMDFGYDPANGVWAECPGYSQGVTGAMMEFIYNFNSSFDTEILQYYPVMYKAVEMLPQYMFPNSQTVGFGDTNYGAISTEPIKYMIMLAQQSGDKDAEAKFTSMLRMMDPSADKVAEHKPKVSVEALFAGKPLEIDTQYPASSLSDYLTQTFYAPNVSWHVQRMGWGKDGLMASLNASLGNHMHSNGINLELYGKGIVLGADPGKGANYLQPAYLEYYSQFPAHNTVMVDGVSKYTEMMSYHAFELEGEYPRSEQKEGYYPRVTYSNVSFVEPETMSDQNRTVSAVRCGEVAGYYVDIFRSARRNGKDKFHDYYYHNLGQTMDIMDVKGAKIELIEEEKVGFAGGHLYALDYMWGEKYAAMDGDCQVEWKMDYPDGQEDIYMNLWMKGSAERELISIYSPACKAFRDNKVFPYDVYNEPYLTFIARQNGEAWDRPFVSVFEPYTSTDGKCIESIEGFDDELGAGSFAGVIVTTKSGEKDYIFSSNDLKMAQYKDMKSDGAYSMVRTTSDGSLVLFMGSGTQLSYGEWKIEASERGNVVLMIEDGKIALDNQVEVKITKGRKSRTFTTADQRTIKL
ncbi:MAG: hypothetical protein SNF93_02900 [Rikenellaceae bacterium]